MCGDDFSVETSVQRDDERFAARLSYKGGRLLKWLESAATEYHASPWCC